MPIVLTPTLATATPVLNETKRPAATRHTTRGTRTRKVPDTEDGSRRVAVVTGGAGAIRVGFRGNSGTVQVRHAAARLQMQSRSWRTLDRKSTRLNSSHQ